MATNSRGDFPINSAWFLQRRRRGNVVPQKPIVIATDDAISGDVFSEYFFESAGAGAINATASQTLGATTQSAAADVLIEAEAAQTLGATTQSATADLIVAATAAQTLADATQSAGADLLIEAEAAQTLGAATLAAEAALTVEASASQTLDAVTLGATATLAAVPVVEEVRPSGGWATLASVRGPKPPDDEAEAPRRRQKRKKTGPLDPSVIKTEAGQVHTGVIAVRPAANELANYRRMKREAAESRAARLRQIALSDDEWMMMN